MSIISCTSPRPSWEIFPTSSVTSAPSVSFSRRSSSPRRRTSSPRRGAGTSRHASNAADGAGDGGVGVGLARPGDAADLLAGDRRPDDEVAVRDARRVDAEALEQVRGGCAPCSAASRRQCSARDVALAASCPTARAIGTRLKPRPRSTRRWPAPGRAARTRRSGRSSARRSARPRSMSCPRSAIRTGCAASGVTRYWYQVMSQAKVSTVSALTPARGTIDTFGSPRLFATPATVRRNVDWLKRSAASTSASSSSESRRRIGSETTGSASSSRAPRSACHSVFWRLRRGCCCSAGETAWPSRTQPWSSATSLQSGHTSTNSWPSGEKRSVCSPISSVRSQIAHVRVTFAFVTLMEGPL